MIWLDREKQKKRIVDWLNNKSTPFLLTVLDSQEFEDITNWLGDIPKLEVSIAYLNTDSEITRFNLLETIVNELGEVNFPKFKTLYEKKSKTEIQIIINQTMGSDIQSESSVSFNNNSQNININNPDPESVKRFFFDSKINEFFENFLDDLYYLSKKKERLIVCRFRGNGFDSLDDKFKYWFQDQFIRKIKLLNFKILILCEQNADDIVASFDYNNRYCLEALELSEILPVSKKFLDDQDGLFCKGIVNEKNEITYKIFKMKLQKNISK